MIQFSHVYLKVGLNKFSAILTYRWHLWSAGFRKVAISDMNQTLDFLEYRIIKEKLGDCSHL